MKTTSSISGALPTYSYRITPALVYNLCVSSFVRSSIHPSLSSSYKWVYASLRTCFYFLFVVAPIVVVVVLLFPYTQYERSEYIKWGINLHRNFYFLNGIVASLFQHVVDSDKWFASSISPKWRFHSRSDKSTSKKDRKIALKYFKFSQNNTQ